MKVSNARRLGSPSLRLFGLDLLDRRLDHLLREAQCRQVVLSDRLASDAVAERRLKTVGREISEAGFPLECHRDMRETAVGMGGFYGALHDGRGQSVKESGWIVIARIRHGRVSGVWDGHFATGAAGGSMR